MAYTALCDTTFGTSAVALNNSTAMTGGMAVVNEPSNRLESYQYIFDRASYSYSVIAICVGGPIVAYLSGNLALMFYTHVALGAFWFGLDFFIEYVLAPAMDDAGPDTASGLIPSLQPNAMVFGEGLTVGTIISGIALADQLGYLANPSIWIWGALGIAAILLVLAFVPMHHYQMEMLMELESPEPDGERIQANNKKALRTLKIMVVLMLAAIVTMTGLRGLIGL